MSTVSDILDISARQKCTCMYSEEELKSFSQEKLDVIHTAIKELGNRSLERIKSLGSCKRKETKINE